MSISLIAALSKNDVIGNNNQLPWHLPADLAWFKRQTLNKSVVMGRCTYESIGFALPNRANFVLSRQPLSLPNVTHYSSIEEILQLATHQEVMIIGGAQLYQLFLPHCNRLYLTHIALECDGDTYFPDYQAYQWQSLFQEQHHADATNPYDYRFEILTKQQ